MSRSAGSERHVKQVEGVGFSLAGKVSKSERIRIEGAVEDYIRKNYALIRAQFAAQANAQSGAPSTVRLCISRANSEVSIVPVNDAGMGVRGGGVGGGGVGGGGAGSKKCQRRQRRSTSAAATDPHLESSNNTTNTYATGTSTVSRTPATARANKVTGQLEALDRGSGGKSMEAAIEYLLSRDRSTPGGLGGGGGGGVPGKERLLRSNIPKLQPSFPTASSNVLSITTTSVQRSQSQTAKQRRRQGETELESSPQVKSIEDKLNLIAEQTSMSTTAAAAATAGAGSRRLVGAFYDCNSYGLAFRMLFPTVQGEFFVLYDHGESHCRRMLTALGFTEKLESEETNTFRSADQMAIMWCNGSISASKRKSRLGYHIVNRLRFRGLITNKCSLVRTLAEFEVNHCRLVPKGLEASSFLPATIHMNGAGAMDVFDKIRHKGMFLIKPGYSDCGKGIVLYRSDGTLGKLIDTLCENYPNYQQRDLVLQKYIENPLLLAGKKFDLRVFLLVIPNQRKEVGVYAFVHPGYARLACRNYDSNSDDLTLHLTNQAVQHKDKSYKLVKESTVWSPDTLNEFLNSHQKELNVPCENWVKRRMFPRVRAILAHLVSVVSSSLCDEPLSYELFGCDFLVDDQFNVWLLEVNSDPSLNKSTAVLRQVITQVVEEAVGLAVEVLQRAARNMPIKSLATEQDFRKVFSHTNETVQRCVLAENRIRYPQYFVHG